MNPLFRIDLSISDSLKTVRKSVLIYETIIKVAFDLLLISVEKFLVLYNLIFVVHKGKHH